MNRLSLKPYLPRSLTGRAVLILILPVVILQLVFSAVLLQRYVADVTQQMTVNLGVEMGYVLEQLDAAPDLVAARKVARTLGPRLDFRVLVPSRGAMVDSRRWYDLSGRAVIDALRAQTPGVYAVDAARSKSSVHMRVGTRHGPVDLRFPRARVSAANPHQLLVVMLATGIIMTVIAYLFLRNQLRPITRLASAAEAFGKGRHQAYKPSGAIEVRSAGLAFLDMRDRIERQIEQRTLMLSGVSHDLRTPLTRMTLGLGMLPEDPEVTALQNDVDEMTQLVDEFLAFSRSNALDAPEPVDAAELVRAAVTAGQKAGQNVQVAHVDETGLVELRPTAVRRALDNLIGNAVRYGDRAWVSLDLLDRTLRLRVEDDGPGIPEHHRGRAVQAFARLDPSRNQSGPGVGLGLSIAADIARSHGGQLRLGHSSQHGGLRADIVIPR